MAISAGTISAQNTFTAVADFRGTFSFSLSGTWAGTVTLQRSYDSGVSWLDVKTYTANIEEVGYEGYISKNGASYRAGIKTGAYTSGDAVIRVSQ